MRSVRNRPCAADFSSDLAVFLILIPLNTQVSAFEADDCVLLEPFNKKGALLENKANRVTDDDGVTDPNKWIRINHLRSHFRLRFSFQVYGQTTLNSLAEEKPMDTVSVLHRSTAHLVTATARDSNLISMVTVEHAAGRHTPAFFSAPAVAWIIIASNWNWSAERGDDWGRDGSGGLGILRRHRR